MPELGSYGSVRGALSNERLYRDSGAPYKWLIYICFLIKSYNRRRLAEAKIATTSPPDERDRTRRFPVAHRVRLD